MTQAQRTAALVHFFFKRRQKPHLPNPELLDVFQIHDDPHAQFRQPAIEQMLYLQRLVVFRPARDPDDHPTACLCNSVTHSRSTFFDVCGAAPKRLSSNERASSSSGTSG